MVILRMSRLSTIDATGATVLRDAIGRLERRGIIVYLSGLRPEHERALTAVGLVVRLAAEGRCFDATPDANAAARLG